MARKWLLIAIVMVGAVLGLAAWLGIAPSLSADRAVQKPLVRETTPLRIGIIPERDVFGQRARYRVLADYLSHELARPIDLVTANSYDNILRDFEEKQVDGAFLGSLVAVLAVDRMGARVLVKQESAGGITTYRGVVFARADSNIHSFEDLAGKSIAMVRTTTGGHLYPMYELMRHGLLDGANPPKIVWVGTHDDVVNEVAQGYVDAGAMKDLRLDDFEAAHPEVKFRRLGMSQPVPDSALVMRRDVSREVCNAIASALLNMNSSETGAAALKTFGAVRFVPCQVEEYSGVFEMVFGLRQGWEKSGLSGSPPRPP